MSPPQKTNHSPLNGSESFVRLREVFFAFIESGGVTLKPLIALDKEGNNALNRLLEICEWDPAHDRAKMLVIARALLDGGVSYSQHNVFGDTAYSIAKAKRYCGPDHPVTIMLRNLCYAKGKVSGDRCLATYEVQRRST